MDLPTPEQTLAYFEQFHVPSNIKTHCLKVREVATFLVAKLKEKGVEINSELVDRCALMHDLFKVVVLDKLEPSEKYHPEPYTEQEIVMWKELRSKYKGMFESEVAYEIFKDDYPELAKALRNSSDPYNRNKTWEELIVHYADWRISGNKMLPLPDRLEYLKRRYPRDDDGWDRYSEVIKKDEKKIFENLDFIPEELATEIKNDKGLL